MRRNLEIRKEIIDELAKYTVRVQLIPELDDIIAGRSEISEIREVSPTDLLGRDPVPPQALQAAARQGGQCAPRVRLESGSAHD